MKRDFWKHFDFWLFGTVVILTIFGVVMIRSAIAGNENLTDLVSRQTIWAGITVAVILVVSLVDYHYYAAFSRPMYIATAALLAVIFRDWPSVIRRQTLAGYGLVLYSTGRIGKDHHGIGAGRFFCAASRRTEKLALGFSQFFANCYCGDLDFAAAQFKQFDRDFRGVVCPALVRGTTYKVPGGFRSGGDHPGGCGVPFPGNLTSSRGS